jgi:glycosyltransferase involved in cell wall biosynthesis
MTNILQVPKFSVVIPIYNREKFIEDAISSVEAQRYENIEIICVDDGSTDGSFDKLLELQTKSRFKPDNFVVHRHEKPATDNMNDGKPIPMIADNRGTNMALNTGFNLATGDFIGILDSDDMLAPPFTISTLVEAYQSEPLLDVCWTLYEAFDQEWKNPRTGSRSSWKAPRLQKEVIIQNLIRLSCFHFLTMRTSSYRNKFATFENMPPTSVDYAWVLENMFRGEFRRINHVGYYYRTKTPGSHSLDGNKEQQSVATQCRLNALNYAHQNGYLTDEDIANIKERCKEIKEDYLEKKHEKERLVSEGKLKEEELPLFE